MRCKVVLLLAITIKIEQWSSYPNPLGGSCGQQCCFKKRVAKIDDHVC
jgi:hypothetical protein